MMQMVNTDVLIIGAGITGTSLARALSRYHVSVRVIDRACDIAEGATKANSGLVHAGYDAVPGTRKAYYNVRGAEMYPGICEELGIPYRRNGALVIGFDEKDRDTLTSLYHRGIKNRVKDLRLIGREELLGIEPALNPDVCFGLDVPSGAVISPYETAFAMADHAALNGAAFDFNQNVVSIIQADNGLWSVCTDSDVYQCKVVVNCAGCSGAELHNRMTGDDIGMIFRRGQYYLLDRANPQPFSRTVFQCPSPMGKGVLVTPTVHGNLLLGPTAEDIPDPMDTSTTSDGLADILNKALRTWPGLSVRTNITNFSGIRAHLLSDDFMIGPVKGCEHAYEAIGIESPGLSSAPAIAEDLSALIAEDLSLKRKDQIVPPVKYGKPFSEMTDAERKEAVRDNPLYGNIICRCEVVTEYEIRQSIRRPVGARTIDGVKRRTRAGMGRCQGGFCMPRVAEIIAEETGCALNRITKNGGNGLILSDSIENCLKEGGGHD